PSDLHAGPARPRPPRSPRRAEARTPTARSPTRGPGRRRVRSHYAHPVTGHPTSVHARRLRTPRGEFAAVDVPTAPGVTPRGVALLLPGYTGSKEDFALIQEPLAARGYRTVAVDGRGQYESDGPADDESAYAREELARDVLAQAEALGTPVHLVGHSLGGQIARAAVILDHTPFRSLTLMSSGPGRISVSQEQRVKLLRDALAVMSMAECWKAILAMGPPEEVGGPA